MIHRSTLEPHYRPTHQQWNSCDQPTHQHWTPTTVPPINNGIPVTNPPINTGPPLPSHLSTMELLWSTNPSTLSPPLLSHTSTMKTFSLLLPTTLETLNHLWHAAAKHVMLPESALLRESAVHAVNIAILVRHVLYTMAESKADKFCEKSSHYQRAWYTNQPGRSRDLDLYQQCQANSGCMTLKSNNWLCDRLISAAQQLLHKQHVISIHSLHTSTEPQ